MGLTADEALEGFSRGGTEDAEDVFRDSLKGFAYGLGGLGF